MTFETFYDQHDILTRETSLWASQYLNKMSFECYYCYYAQSLVYTYNGYLL